MKTIEMNIVNAETTVKPVAVSFNKLVVSYTVHAVDLDKYTCTLEVELSGKAPKVYHDVLLSGLLAAKFRMGDDWFVVGKQYTSEMASPDKAANPYQLVQFRDKDGRVRFMLACVDQWKKIVLRKTDPFGGVHEQPIYKFHSKKFFCRYRDHVNTDTK